ncbi:MepB family protein [Candidatus Regiella endosymbiont of Tuberolachnus salignus]|uniref:MepB family protein n=1 Tax=Candidatus Regiella endosymbiont of Tuberolachnus salignus TaxID=3077956 RepID=UPI0030CD09AB
MSLNPAIGIVPAQLTHILNEIILAAGLKITLKPCREVESAEYGACRLDIEGKTVLFRVANTTPTKIGQFVTVWQRQASEGEIAPFDYHDPIDFIMVYVFEHQHCGLFIFNKDILAQKNVISMRGKGGKRGIRVYAPWISTIAKQAIATQKWQREYFISANSINGTNKHHILDIERVHRLFGIT